MLRALERVLVVALSALLLVAAVASSSPLCCIVASLEVDSCCEHEDEGDEGPLLAAGDCCDDEATAHSATQPTSWTELPARPPREAPRVQLVVPSRYAFASRVTAPGLRRALSPPERIPRIRATSRLLI